MFKEILHIVPKLSQDAMNAMDRTLSSRFAKIAKKFGKGLSAGLLGGGLAGLGLGIIDKLLNPLKEVNESIARLMEQGDDIATNARQFGTTTGKLAKLQGIAQSTGLAPNELDVLLQKYASKLAEAQADPKKPSAVSAFANDKDIAESFFQFIQELQKLDPKKQLLVQAEVFGEKQILKMADFLQTDFAKQKRLLGGPTAEQLTPALDKAGDLKDLKDILDVRQQQQDVVAKSKLINEGIIREQVAAQKRALDAENAKLAGYEGLAATAKTADVILNTLSGMAVQLTGIVTKFSDLSKKMDSAAEWGASIKNLLKWRGGK